MTHTSHHHVVYHLNCAQFDAVLARADGRCELCDETFMTVPIIDHDHERGFRGVRGLVCMKCNARLRQIDSGERPVDDRARAYLDASWHLSITHTPRPHYRMKDKDPVQTFRIKSDLWSAAKAKASERDESVSQVIRKALERYVKRT